MKIWVYLTLATIVTTTAVTWADVNFNVFEYNPQAAFHKKPKIDYVAEISKIDTKFPERLTFWLSSDSKKFISQALSPVMLSSRQV